MPYSGNVFHFRPRLVYARRTPEPFTGWRGFFPESSLRKKAMPGSRKITKFPSKRTTIIRNMNVGDVGINANVEGDLSINIRRQRPKATPISVIDQITPENKLILQELTEKIVDLGLITGFFLEKNKAFPSIRRSLNKQLKITSINEANNTQFQKGEKYLTQWLYVLLTDDKVIKNPPDWWRDYLIIGIHTNTNKNKINEATYKAWMIEKFSRDSSTDLNNKELAELFNFSKNGRFDLTRIKENPRDFTLRLQALIQYFEEREREGNFSRENTGMRLNELFLELQSRDKTLFAMAESTFKKFTDEARKITPFRLKTGRPSTVKL